MDPTHDLRNLAAMHETASFCGGFVGAGGLGLYQQPSSPLRPIRPTAVRTGRFRGSRNPVILGPAPMVDGWSTSPRLQRTRALTIGRRFPRDSRHFVLETCTSGRALRAHRRIMSPLL